MRKFLILLFQLLMASSLLWASTGCSINEHHSSATTHLIPSNNNTCRPIEPLEIDLTTHLGDRQTFIKGDYVRFLASTNQDSYFLLIYKNALGDIIQLIPSPKLGDGFYKEAFYFEIPDSRSGFVFRISEPFGEETIELFASNLKFPNFVGELIEQGFKKYQTEKFYQQLKLYRERSLSECFNFQQAITHFISVKKPKRW